MSGSPHGPRPEEVERALHHGFFSMAFQPIVEASSGAVHGFEALLRGATGTALENPGPLFHDATPLPAQLLHELDLACVRAALKGGRRLPPSSKLFVNVHGETLWYAERKGHDLFQLLETIGFPPSRIVLEISEDTDKQHIRVISRALRPFRRLGIRVALDDVGTTDAWLHHLLTLQPDYLKIDREFIRGLHRQPRKQDLLAGFLLLAGRVGATLIAEGVETSDENTAVRKVGVPYAQGWWLGRPAPVEKWISPAEDAPEPPVAAVYTSAFSARKGVQLA